MELLVVFAIIVALAVVVTMSARQAMKKARYAQITQSSRAVAMGVSGYMAEHGKLAAMIFGVQYPAREVCKGMDGVGMGYCGPEWRVKGTSAWKTYGQNRTNIWGWAVADAQLITNQGTSGSITDPSSRPVMVYARASASSYQDNLGYPTVITRMQEFSKNYLDGATIVSYMDGSSRFFPNIQTWADPNQGWEAIWPLHSR